MYDGASNRTKMEDRNGGKATGRWPEIETDASDGGRPRASKPHSKARDPLSRGG